MNRANPTEMRKALVMADEMKKAGVLFVPLPVVSPDDHQSLLDKMRRRLNYLEKEAKKNG